MVSRKALLATLLVGLIAAMLAVAPLRAAEDDCVPCAIEEPVGYFASATGVTVNKGVDFLSSVSKAILIESNLADFSLQKMLSDEFSSRGEKPGITFASLLAGEYFIARLYLYPVQPVEGNVRYQLDFPSGLTLEPKYQLKLSGLNTVGSKPDFVYLVFSKAAMPTNTDWIRLRITTQISDAFFQLQGY